MSDTHIPEICDSKFPHHPMREVDKNYFIRADGFILCDECYPPWINLQSTVIANSVYQSVLTLMRHTLDGILVPGNNSVLKFDVPLIEFMQSLFLDKIQTIDCEIIYQHACGTDPMQPTEGTEFWFKIAIGTFFTMKQRIYPFAVLGDAGSADLITANTMNVYNLIRNTAYWMLLLYVESFYRKMSDEEVQAAIDARKNSYESTASGDPTCSCGCECPNGTSTGEEDVCCVCGKGLVSPYYIYQNAAYCIDDMYAIVVDASVRCNLSEVVGLAQAEETIPNTNRRYDTTDEFKIAVIDRYFNYMKSFSNILKAYKV